MYYDEQESWWNVGERRKLDDATAPTDRQREPQKKKKKKKEQSRAER
jgi:hypothetical protein